MDEIKEELKPEFVGLAANGDAYFTIRIPEVWHSAILAEAELQNQDVVDYLQERIDEGVDKNWFC